MASPLDPPAQLFALPSPPTSPTSPRAATARIRIKASRLKRPNSICYVPSAGLESHAEQPKSTSPPVSRIVTANLDTPGSETTRTIALASASAAAGERSRRQSSITYYTPSSPAPWSPRQQPSRTQSSSMDSQRDVGPVVANGRENASKRSSLVLSSRSPSARESVSSLDVTGAREREPLTLVEKHADLLHFIAQKERKCLELRDQLAVHEKELAELKRKWERIVNRGYDSLPNQPAPGLGGVALDGLKESVRMIAAGFSDLGGAIQEVDSTENDVSKSKPLTRPPYEDGTVVSRTKRAGSEHLSADSMSSTQESSPVPEHALHDGEGEMTAATVVTAPSLSRAGSLGARMHKRASRAIVAEQTTLTSTPVSLPPQSPQPANLDVGMSLVLAPSPTLVPPFLGVPPEVPFTSSTMSSMSASAQGPAPSPTSWMDTMGKKLSELHKGHSFSKGQKRASSLLAGVSSTISAALLPGPTATTPAPLPTSPAHPAPASASVSTSPVSLKGSLTTRLSQATSSPRAESDFDTRPYPSYKSMADWLDDEEQTVHVNGAGPGANGPPHPHRDGDATDDAAEAVSTFDDDWNW